MTDAPFQIKHENGKAFIENTETGTQGPHHTDGAKVRAALREKAAELNSSIVLDRLGIF